MTDLHRWPEPQQSMEYPPRNPFTVQHWVAETGYALVILGLIWWPENNGGGWRWNLLLTALYAAGRASWFGWDARKWRQWQTRNGQSTAA